MNFQIIYLLAAITGLAVAMYWTYSNQPVLEVEGRSDCREFPFINDLYYMGLRLLGHRYYLCEDGELVHIRTH